MAYKKVYLRRKQFEENFRVILLKKLLMKIFKIDLTYTYKFKFIRGNLYLKTGYCDVLVVEKTNLDKWLGYLREFTEICSKLNKLKPIEIDFPITNQLINKEYYSYFFRYNDKKLYLDMREGKASYDPKVYNHLLSKKMKILVSKKITMEKIKKIFKGRMGVDKQVVRQINSINKIVGNLK